MTRREQRLLITSLVFLGALCQWSDARKLLAPLSSTALKNLPRGGGSELSATTIVDDEDAAAAYRSPLLNQNSGEEDLVATNTGKVLVGGSSSATVTVAAQEGASIPNEVFNLVKSIVGAGVLGLPAGTKRNAVQHGQSCITLGIRRCCAFLTSIFLNLFRHCRFWRYFHGTRPGNFPNGSGRHLEWVLLFIDWTGVCLHGSQILPTSLGTDGVVQNGVDSGGSLFHGDVL